MSVDSAPASPSPFEHGRTEVTDNLEQLLEIFPPHLREALLNHEQRDTMIEVVMDLGRWPEARFPTGAKFLSQTPITAADLEFSVERVGQFSGDNRAGIERTLHRISAMRNRQGKIIGLTCRVGRAVFGTIGMIRDLVETGQSILMLGRPGVGKTTALREIARVLADDLKKRVVIIDTSNEIAGDGDIPHPAIGRARRMQVAEPELQHKVMIEAVENHTPEVIVIDEIGTELEALAARTIAERGVQLVGTAHGNQLENLIKNPTLADLIGGIQAVTLGDDEARRRRSQKTVLERKALPTFEIAVEMLERQRWVVHTNVAAAVDLSLRGVEPVPEIRTVTETGELEITQPTPPPPLPFSSKQKKRAARVAQPQSQSGGWQTSGRMEPVPHEPHNDSPASGDDRFEQMLQTALYGETAVARVAPEAFDGQDTPLYVYPYGIGRSQLEQAIEILEMPVVLTKDMSSADVVLALRSQIKNHAKLRQISKAKQIPIHPVKSNTIPQISKALRRALGLEELGVHDEMDVRLFSYNGSDDELEALEEARLAVEQIVLPKGQPVELLPRSPKVRKMQHELVEHYRLQSDSFGEEPNRRLRIYPA
ncbi:MAG: R3H domain-containing nucleic acid-binding protein [Spirulinaceae cyanobacterium]